MNERRDLLESLLAVLQVDRVDDRLSLRVREPDLDRLLVRRVEHQRHAHLLDEHLEEAAQVGHFVAVGLLGGDVHQVRPPLDLRPRDLRCLVPLLQGDQVAELLRSEHVGALADDDRPDVVADLQRIHAGECAPETRRDRARREAGGDLRQPGDVPPVRAAASAQEVQPPVLAEARQGPRQHLRGLQVAAVLVRQARVRHAGDAGPRQLGERADVVGHELRTRGAVQPQVEELPVLQRDRQRLDRLAGQHGPHRLDGAAHRDRDPLLGWERILEPIDPDQARFDVARVLRGLEQEIVDASLVQPARLRLVVLDELLERHSAGHRDGLGGGPHRPGDETRAVLRPEGVGLRAREERGRAVDLHCLLLQPVFREHQRGAAEGVRLQDVGASLQVSAVDAADDVRPGEVQGLVASL